MCGRIHRRAYDRTLRRVRDLPCGGLRIFVEVELRRVACHRCGAVKRERLDSLADNPRYTKRFAFYVGRRCRAAPITEIAEELRLEWHTVKELETQYMREQLRRAGAPAPEVIGIDEVSIRKGGFEESTPVPDGRLTAAHLPDIATAFHDTYRRRFGYADPGVPVHGVTWRVIATGPTPRVLLQKSSGAGAAGDAIKAMRPAYWPEGKAYVDSPVYDRYRLGAGMRITGPAIVEERESTTVIPPRCTATVDEWLNLAVTLDTDGEGK